MHFGATLRLLRLDSGLSLRDLARRLSVSGAYLSRVENGLDSAPTPARIEAIARELNLPEPLLLGLAHQVSPLVSSYVRDEPGTAQLLLELARRRLTRTQLEEIQAFVDVRFPLSGDASPRATAKLSALLDVDRIVVGMTCWSFDDVLDVAGGRLASVLGSSGAAVARLLKQRESEASSAIGGGVAVPCVHSEGAESSAALVTLARPLARETPDGQPVRTVVVLAGPRSSAVRRVELLHLARWTASGLSSKLEQATTPAEVLAQLVDLEAGG